MRRLAWCAAFLALGLFASWQAILLAIHVSNLLAWPVLARGNHRCWDIEHCHVPWWGYVLIMASIAGPTLVWAYVGFRLALSGAAAKWVRAVLLLLVTTMVFYLALYAVM
jgi:hypothetical protein